jgi:uracil-DNA glycosylase
VPRGIAVPPSLQNIFAEIQRDLGLPIPDSGCLQSWAEQGVLLLNSVLTVEAGRAGSHQSKGWEPFTDAIIDALSQQRLGLVFMLWGSYAQAKGRVIDRNRHCVLKAPHPSPLSAYRGFMGCGHFSAANRYLQGEGQIPIDWQLPT